MHNNTTSTAKKAGFIASLILIILLLVLIGWYKEKTFVHLNSVLETAKLNSGQKKDIFLPLIKWVWTIFFSLLYLATACLTIKIIFNNLNLIKLTIIIYLAVIIISFLFIIAGSLFNSFETGYVFSHRLMEMVQSPVMIMLLIPAFKIKSMVND